jgi:hypothetical protein
LQLKYQGGVGRLRGQTAATRPRLRGRAAELLLRAPSLAHVHSTARLPGDSAGPVLGRRHGGCPPVAPIRSGRRDRVAALHLTWMRPGQTGPGADLYEERWT